MGIRQVAPWTHWPSGDSRPIAVLPYDLTELSSRYGLEYEEGIDDFDRYRLAAIDLGHLGQAWISKHEGDPNPGTLVHVDAGADISESQSRLVELLSLERDQLLWIAPVSVPA